MMPGPPPVMTVKPAAASSAPHWRAHEKDSSVKRAEPKTVTHGPDKMKRAKTAQKFKKIRTARTQLFDTPLRAGKKAHDFGRARRRAPTVDRYDLVIFRRHRQAHRASAEAVDGRYSAENMGTLYSHSMVAGGLEEMS